MSSLFLDESLPAEAFVVGDVLSLTGDEARHAATVSRVRVGERVLLGNGFGVQATCVAVAVESRRVQLRVESVRVHPLEEFRLVLVQALAKGDRDERAVQAAVEVGVDAVLPWQAERSVSRWSGEKLDRGVERWQKVAREATKQSLRPWVAQVLRPESTASLLQHTGIDRLLILEPSATLRLSDLRRGDIEPESPRGSICVLVGPEGGITPRELSVLADAGAIPVRLGESVLRTSTAGPVALGLINVALGRW